MLWRPIQISPEFTNGVDLLKMDTNLKRSVGLYKVQGVAVEAVMGGIFHHFVRTSFRSSTVILLLTPSVAIRRGVRLLRGCSTRGFFRTFCFLDDLKACLTIYIYTPRRFVNEWVD